MRIAFVALLLNSISSLACAEDSVEVLISKLRTDPLTIRAKLAERGGPALPLIIAALNDESTDSETRQYLVIVLGEIGGEQVVEPLKRALQHPHLRWLAIGALGQVGPPAKPVVPQLAKIAMDSKFTLREARGSRIHVERELDAKAAVQALGRIGHGSEEAVVALTHRMSRFRDDQAAASLANLGEPSVEKLLTLAHEYTKDERTPDDRKYGEAYAQLTNGVPLKESMMPVLLKHVTQGDDKGFIASLALANIGAPAKDRLFELLDHENPRVRADAATALVRMNHLAGAARRFRKANVEDPVSPEEVLPKLIEIARLPDGSVDPVILEAIRAFDPGVIPSDPRIIKLIEDARRQ